MVEKHFAKPPMNAINANGFVVNGIFVLIRVY